MCDNRQGRKPNNILLKSFLWRYTYKLTNLILVPGFTARTIAECREEAGCRRGK